MDIKCYGIRVVFKHPVGSSYLVPRGSNQDWDWLTFVSKPKITNQNQLVAVTNQLGPKKQRIVYIWARLFIYVSVNIIVVYIRFKMNSRTLNLVKNWHIHENICESLLFWLIFLIFDNNSVKFWVFFTFLGVFWRGISGLVTTCYNWFWTVS